MQPDFRLPATLWLTGLSGAGKTTIATALHLAYERFGIPARILDGDQLREGLNRDLGFSKEDRRENVRRIAEVAKILNSAGLFVTVAVISPSRADRDLARTIIGPRIFREVYVNTPQGVCEERDPKGLYRRARAGVLHQFTGVSASYEPPLFPDLTVSGVDRPLNETVSELLSCVAACTTDADVPRAEWANVAASHGY
jgi:adenylylsulfate kinase